MDHVRARAAKKRSGGRPVTLAETLLSTARPSVELKLFAGLLANAIALSLAVSERTVKVDWRVVRAWLMKELAGEGVR